MRYTITTMDSQFEPNSPLEKHFRFNPLQKAALKRLGIVSAHDLLFYFPNRYEEPGLVKNIKDLAVGEDAVIYAKVLSAKTLKGWKSKIPMAEVLLDDGTGPIKAVWFHQAYMAKKIPEGHFGEFRGKVTERKGELYLANPDVRETPPPAAAKDSLFSQDDEPNLFLVPIYPETRGLSSGWFYYHIETILKTGLAGQLTDPLPVDILKKYNLPGLATALYWIHSPKRSADAAAARKRFAFEEIFYLQLKRLQDKTAYQSNPSFTIPDESAKIKEFLDRFPFEPTGAQKKAIAQICADFRGGQPMTRLLEGDVGSGKTAVAATTAFAVVNAGYEVAYLAPTEILA
ncbi:MAG: hypothetical protein NTY66_03855, partial [Candidatus Vogelbacteria bacterium]|nr:hypothetical protein [Candidatus Vogelbacteria bacterium]